MGLTSLHEKLKISIFLFLNLGPLCRQRNNSVTVFSMLSFFYAKSTHYYHSCIFPVPYYVYLFGLFSCQQPQAFVRGLWEKYVCLLFLHTVYAQFNSITFMNCICQLQSFKLQQFIKGWRTS